MNCNLSFRLFRSFQGMFALRIGLLPNSPWISLSDLRRGMFWRHAPYTPPPFSIFRIPNTKKVCQGEKRNIAGLNPIIKRPRESFIFIKKTSSGYGTRSLGGETAMGRHPGFLYRDAGTALGKQGLQSLYSILI